MADPLYFESYRIAPWKNRGVEVDVILDLMIHDIDMIIGLVDSPVESVDAVGTPVLGPQYRPRQCPHHLRVGLRRQRHREPGELQDRAAHARVWAQPLSELRSRRGTIFGYRLRGDPMTEGLAAIATETHEIPKQDSLANEIDAFLDCIATGSKPLVDGRAGCEALRVASMINESIEEHPAKVQAARALRLLGQAGPSTSRLGA